MKHLEPAPDESEPRGRAQLALNVAGLGAIDYLPQGDLLRCDTRARSILGLPDSNTRLAQLVSRTHPEDVGPLQQALSDALHARAEVDIRLEHNRRVRLHLGADPSEGWRIVGAVQALGPSPNASDESHQHFRRFIDSAPAALAAFDRQMHYIAVSGRWLSAFKWKRDVLGRSHYEVFPEVPARWRQAHRRGLAGETVREDMDRFDRPDGSVQWFRWEVQPWHTDQDEIGGIVVYFEDITDRVETEQALRESETRFRAIFENAPMGIAQVGLDGQWLRVNDRLCAIIGFDRDELSQLTFQDITHPDDLASDVEQMHQVLEGRIPTYSMDKRYLRKDGTVMWVSLTVSLVRNPSGEPDYFIAIVEDIAGRRQGEEALRHAIALRDEFLSIASHELRTPLTALSLQLQSLRRQLGAGSQLDPLWKRLEGAIRQTERLANLVESLLDVSRMSAGRAQLRVEPVDLRELVVESIERLSAAAERARCQVRLLPGEPLVGAWDRSRLEEVVLNLLSNAIKYGPGKPVELALEANPTEVVLNIRDQGIGIAEVDQERVFERFERAVSANYGGLGLGLYISRQIVRAHGGEVLVKSAPGRGSVFSVRLPWKTVEKPAVEARA